MIKLFDSPKFQQRKVDSQGRPYRMEIQGLRALSIIQVLLFHAWHVGSPIGVIVFIMLSAFLLVGSYTRSVERAVNKASVPVNYDVDDPNDHKVIDYSAVKIPLFAERWLRTFKRLIPLLFITVVVTYVLSILLLSSKRYPGLFHQAIASLFYYQNWLLKSETVNYFAATPASASPFMHLWSMSMQGQIFLLFPFLLWLVAVLTKKTRQLHNYRKWAFVMFVIIAVASFLWTLSLYFSQETDITTYYFDTRIRLWEFSIGAIVALIEPKIKIRKRTAQILSTLALGVLVLFFLVSIGTYPGPIGSIPLFAAAILLLTMKEQYQPPLLPLLRYNPIVEIGNSAYALYLIHWPLFSLYMSYFFKESLGWYTGPGLIIISIVLALLATKLIDLPLTNSTWLKNKPKRQLLMITTIWVISALVIVSVNKVTYVVPTTPIAEDSHNYPGARVLENPSHGAARKATLPARPNGLEYDNEWGTLGYPCNGRLSNPIDNCGQTEKYQGDRPLVLVFGNSHATQYSQMFKGIAKERGWQLALAQIPYCVAVDAEHAQSPECAKYSQEITDWILKVKPDALITVSTHTSRVGPEEWMAGHAEMVQTFIDAGIPVIGIRDTPRFRWDMYECSEQEYNKFVAKGGVTYLSGPDSAAFQQDGDLPDSYCSRPAKEVYDPAVPRKLLSEVHGDFHFIDPEPVLCPNNMCPGIIGNIYVYLDTNHISRSYATTMEWFIRQELEKTNWLDGRL